MTKHGHDQHGHHGGHTTPPARHSIHKDWRLWAAVVLMLAAMAIYVLSDDESLQPGGPPQAPVPAAP